MVYILPLQPPANYTLQRPAINIYPEIQWSQEEWLTEFAFQGSVLNLKNYPSHPDSFKEEKNVM